MAVLQLRTANSPIEIFNHLKDMQVGDHLKLFKLAWIYHYSTNFPELIKIWTTQEYGPLVGRTYHVKGPGIFRNKYYLIRRDQ